MTVRPIRTILLTLALVAAFVFTSCAAESAIDPGPDPAPNAGSDTAPETTPTAASAEDLVIAENLDAPWSITFHDGVPLVSERDTARVLELDANGDTREVATIEGADPRGEGGLLGIAASEGYLYTYFTTARENRVERRPIVGEPGNLALGDAETVLSGIPSGSIHNGGRLAFGPDGMLYVTTGDAGEPSNSQDVNSLGGKILRLTPTGEVPDDNPFPGSSVYSYGHRNVQGIAWADDGTMYASEFGQNTWDELNVIQGGGNYGWPVVEGIAGRDGYIDPVQQWTPAVASPSGIAIAGGSIFIANLRGERLREVPLDGLASSIEHWVGEHGRLRAVAVTPDGEIWVLTNNTDGRGDPRQGDDRVLRFDAVQGR